MKIFKWLLRQWLCVHHTGLIIIFSGSFEVAVNGTVVHSKLSTLAYPDYEDLSKIILETKEGKSVRKCKEQPITSCSLS